MQSYLPPNTQSLKQFCCTLWLLLTILLIASLLCPPIGFLASAPDVEDPHCDPDYRDVFTATGSRNLFGVSPFPGHLSFTLVKVSDVSWNIVVGRGGQCLMAWICYHVYYACFIRIVEKVPIPYDLYKQLASGSPSITSIPKMVKF